MAHAYTPGLKVTEGMVIRKVRRLPIKGEVLVEEGQAVEPGTPVASTNLPGDPETINVSNYLTLEPEDVPHYMLKKEGDSIQEGETLAMMSSFFGLIKRELKSPVTGTVEMISAITGQITLRKPPVPVEIAAYIDGVVTEILPGEGVVVETTGALVQGIFGVGGERHGPIRCLVGSPDGMIGPEDLDDSCRGQVVVVGRLVRGDVLKRAAEVGVVGLIAGGIIDADLIQFLGHDIGVAITGQEDIPLTVVLTEGFGEMAIAGKTYELLRSLEGRMASINGATQIRAGVMRPEVIVSTGAPGGVAVGESESAGLVAGTSIRIIRQPWFGELAEVVDLPPELQLIESGARVRVLRARLPGGQVVVVPRANVEIIEG